MRVYVGWERGWSKLPCHASGIYQRWYPMEGLVCGLIEATVSSRPNNVSQQVRFPRLNTRRSAKHRSCMNWGLATQRWTSTSPFPFPLEFLHVVAPSPIYIPNIYPIFQAPSARTHTWLLSTISCQPLNRLLCMSDALRPCATLPARHLMQRVGLPAYVLPIWASLGRCSNKAQMV